MDVLLQQLAITDGLDDINMNNNNLHPCAPSPTDSNTSSCTDVTLRGCRELMIRPNTANYNFHTVPGHRYLLALDRTGDVEKERQIEERVKQLGLWHNKRFLERQLYEKLSEAIDEDGLFAAINRCKRKRPIRQRVESSTNEIINTIQSRLVKDELGNNVAYKVDVIMGLFTHNIQHKIVHHTITIKGSTPDNRGTKLHKEVTIEFPAMVDISLIHVSFGAGVFHCEAPFQSRLHSVHGFTRSCGSVSSQSEETESIASGDLKAIEYT